MKIVKVGITGVNGFIGNHLKHKILLDYSEKLEFVDFKRAYFNNSEGLKKFISECDVIVHLASLNRHDDENFLYDENIRLTKKLLDTCESINHFPKIIFSSSVQIYNKNKFSSSKKECTKILKNFSKRNKSSVSILVIPNVFGPFCKPFYNSFISTFCYQVINGKPTIIHVDNEVNLIYIDNLIDEIIKQICLKKASRINEYIIKSNINKKVSEIEQIIKSFKINYLDKGIMPNLDNKFILNLFNTFCSYLPKENLLKKFKLNKDSRGLFVELIKSNCSGQTSFSTTKKGITRGNHFHTRKVERFAVISGDALISIRKFNEKSIFSFELSGKTPAYIDMPIWYTHNIKNIGDSELITIFWINEPYNNSDPDTYFLNV